MDNDLICMQLSLDLPAAYTIDIGIPRIEVEETRSDIHGRLETCPTITDVPTPTTSSPIVRDAYRISPHVGWQLQQLCLPRDG